jgi:nucleotide-binding universal stress UspA family protein
MYTKILVPLDGSKLAECALRHAEALAHAHNSTVLLLSVISPAAIVGRAPADIEAYRRAMETRRAEVEIYLKGVKGAMAEKKIGAEALIGVEPVVGEIVATAEKHDVDLVLIASHGRSGLGRVFFGSVASGVLNKIERPLMVIHPAD